MRTTWLLLGGIALGGCDISGPPAWTADYLVPLDFPALDLSGVPGGEIPLDTVSVTTPIESQDTDGLVGRILESEDLVGLRAEIILSTTLDVTGDLFVSIAPAQGGLFDPTQSITANINLRQGTDTSLVTANLSIFQGAPTLYYQASVFVAGRDGVIPVPPGSQIGVKVNFIGTVQVSK